MDWLGLLLPSVNLPAPTGFITQASPSPDLSPPPDPASLRKQGTDGSQQPGAEHAMGEGGRKIAARAALHLLVLNAFQMYLKAPEVQGVPSHCSSTAGSHLLLSQTSKGERIWVGIFFVCFFLFFFS